MPRETKFDLTATFNCKKETSGVFIDELGITTK